MAHPRTLTLLGHQQEVREGGMEGGGGKRMNYVRMAHLRTRTLLGHQQEVREGGKEGGKEGREGGESFLGSGGKWGDMSVGMTGSTS